MTHAPPLDDIPSPCRRACELDLWRRRCLGCGRTVTEIRQWMLMTAEEKSEVLDRLGLSAPAGS